MTRDEIIAIIKDKSHSPLRGALFTINIFGQVIQRANKDVVVDDNGFDFMIVEKQITNEDNFLDTILPARNDFSKLINTSKNEENWFENAIALHKATFFNEPLVNNSNATLGDSIFSDEQEKGINNVMTNWYKPIQDKIDGEKKLKEFVDRYDFLPIIKINNSEEPKNAIISIKECENCKKEKVNLGKDYDEDKREYIVADVVITQNSITKIPVTIKKGYDPNGLQDEDGIIKFSCDNSGVKIKIIDNDETDYDVDEDEYDLSDAAYGDEFVLEIAPTKLKRGTKFSITFSASDDGDGLGTTSKRIGICGKFNFTIIQDDVFTEAEVNNLLLELKYIKPFADEYSPSEYAGNYCMAGAERGLSELLKNTKDFYSVERETHKRKNKISFSNLNADDRANTFNKLGYINSKIVIPTKDFSISLNKNFEINDENKQKDRGTIVKAKDPKKIYDLFENIKNKIGFHIYYCSIAGANHTMILVINNIDLCDSKFEFWDEHGLSSSLGKLQNIGNGDNGEYGISMQVQWLVRLLRGWKKDNGAENADTFYPSLDCNLYKIQR